jgi:DNA-directed RNA polymerase beta' subunit
MQQTFDGDEMNMHMPQNVMAETELRHLAAIPYQIISPAGNSPIIGIYQDSLLGSYRITRPGVTFTPMQAMDLLMMFPRVNAKALREAGNKVTSFDVLSQIMPPLTMVYKTKLYEDSEEYKTSNNVLEIRDGKYIRGQLEKSVLGSTTKGILHRVFNDFGCMACANFNDDLQNIVTEYMKSSSYSVGISDLIADKITQQKIINVISSQKAEVQSVIDKLHLGIFENNTSKSNMSEFESSINKLLNKANEEAGKIGRTSLSKNNRFLMIVNSGSKGNLINISQMISCLGQQNVDAKRIPYGFDNRTLPHYTKYDDSPNARGFIENSYISGLTAPELFFHAMGGRIGLIDTAVKSVTWETPIVLIENNKPKYIEIGKWIDNQLDTNKENVQHFDERNMELMDTKEVYIPTTDEDGNVSWGEITAITRHDPGTQLYEIKTSGGRSVTVTESKSLLIWNPETRKLKEMLTPDIKVGDCVPVTGDLCKPPVILNHIDISDYLPKSEFVYGTDFNLALNMMNAAMEGKAKITQGWWDQNNGSAFTLPYSKKSSLQRTQVRSNLVNIQTGYVYPYSAVRKDSRIPEKFELTEENGIFIGLFLAEGNADKSGHITITNNDENIRSFVKSWFDKHSIIHKERSRINKIGGLTTTVTGTSSVLAKFITKMVGKGADKKHIPVEAYIANEEFVVGLLNGYYSGDGTVSKNSIDVGSASSRLIEGISMLCSRLGIFGKMSVSQLKSNNLKTKNIKPTHRLSIRSQWGQIFANRVSFLEEAKNKKMKATQWNKSHRNFDTYNDVILDKIVEINVIGVEKNPKMYDLTIPSTLNFGLANGLQVRDTSQTGYIQRRLIKGLEDLKVDYDMTVRNNKGKIIQFAYGDDGFDSTKTENQIIPLVGMSIEDIYMHYDIIGLNEQSNEVIQVYTKGAISRIRKQKAETQALCKKYIDMMIEARDTIVKSIFKNKNENSVKLPVSFQNIIVNIQGQLGLGASSAVDITPMEAFELIEENFKKMNRYAFAPLTKLFEIMYYFYLSPRDLLVQKRFHRKALVILLETISLKHKEALVHPGEMVGVISGQSIGEPTTQLTLNSVTYETEILVRNSNKEIKSVHIGDFTKWGIETSTKIDYMKDKDTTYAELNEYYEVPSGTEDGQTVWRRIEAVTRHPVINEDGTNTMLKVTTKGNREIIATKAKSFMQLVDGKIQGVNGSTLKVGDYLPVSKKPLDFMENSTLKLKDILPPSEYLYGSELQKARSFIHEHQWWKKHANKSFTLPHIRSDSALRIINMKKNILPDCVYMKLTNMCEYRVPEEIPLDYEFGYLVGAYCAEGCMTKHQVSIANNDNDYLAPIQNWCSRYNLTTKIYTQNNKIQEGWKSQDIRIYNTILCRILSKLCGNLSHNKFVSDKIIFSNRECSLGFLDAYIGGDGCVNEHSRCDGNKRSDTISISSVSHRMLSDVQLMLKNLGVLSKLYKIKKPESNNRGSLDIKQCYEVRIANQQGQKLASMLNIPISRKQEKAQGLLDEVFKYEYCKSDLQVPNIIEGITVMQSRNGMYPDIEFDEIISIEEVENTTNYAYDLTVEDTRTFDCKNGINLYDTFHLSGVASKSNVTRGVPRIEEILRLTKNPKNPSLTVHLKAIDEVDQDRADKYSTMMEHKRLVDVVKSIQICFDPNDRATTVEEDRLLMEQYYEFESLINDCLDQSSAEQTPQKSKWVVRMELDAETLLEKNITMDDIHFAIANSHYGNDISCVYSDYNSDKLVFRIRMNSSIFTKGKKRGVADTLDQSDEIYVLKNFQDSLLNNVVLRGINGIENALARKIQNSVLKEDGKYVRKDTWVIDTTGSNLMDTLALDFIDYARTYSNDIREIFNVLGIEAARQVIYNEMAEVMEFSDVYINYHHLSLLCDRMTCNHGLVPIFRSGLLGDNVGTIAKATFEVHTEVFLDAARHGEFDHMRGVSASVMCGQFGNYGTGAFQLVLDMKEMENLEAVEVDKRNASDEIEKAFGKMEDKSDICSKANITIRNNIANIQSHGNASMCDDEYNPGF